MAATTTTTTSREEFEIQLVEPSSKNIAHPKYVLS